jgi:hypothetical protein
LYLILGTVSPIVDVREIRNKSDASKVTPTPYLIHIFNISFLDVRIVRQEKNVLEQDLQFGMLIAV